MNPFPLILSAPSGGGKTTIARRLLETRADVGYSISATTRPPRGNEQDGRDYHFLTAEEFERRRANGAFAEYARVHGQWYGTLREEVDRVLSAGRHVVMAIDVQGGVQCRRAFPDSVLVFLLPPSVEVLIARLRARNTESDRAIAARLQTAVSEIAVARDYNYVVVNDDLDDTTKTISAIIDAECTRPARARGFDDRLTALSTGLQDAARRFTQEP